ncbi:MAG: hypothetical protein GY880_09285 [Planctomycetaceae bacterium]|nr:hypothetical protein [Planctomycetaceae bacterium]
MDRPRSRLGRKRSEVQYPKNSANRHLLSQEIELRNVVCSLRESLDLMQKSMPEKAESIRLRVFEGKSIQEPADQLGMSRATAFRKWNFSKLWLKSRLVDYW